MQALSIPQDASLEVSAQEEKTLEDTRTAEDEEVSRANIDAVFEFACRFIVIEGICTKHFGSIQAATGTNNADASVWKKTQATLDLRHQASDQKIDA